MTLVLLFIFYNFFILYIEVFLFQTTYDKVQYLCVVPIIYMLINLGLNTMKSLFDNINKLFIIGLAFMVALSLIQIAFKYSNIDSKEYIIMILLICQMTTFQKILFIQIIIFLLKVFDISSIRLRNQMNSNSN